MVCVLTPVSAWSEEETLPSAVDGQEVIVGRIAGLPLSHGLDGVYPDYRECVRVDFFRKAARDWTVGALRITL